MKKFDLKRKFLKVCLAVGIILMASLPAICAEQVSTNLEEIDMTNYMKNLQKTIKSNWTPVKSASSNSVVLIFRLNKKGKLLKNPEFKNYILKSSGMEDVDNSAIKALEASKPFTPLPDEYNGEYVDIQFTLDYYIKKEL